MALKIIVHDLGESIKGRIGVWTVGSTAPTGWSDYTSPVGGTTWGTITGTLSNQTDLQTALNAKVTGNGAIVGATKTKITYDTKGLVTSGADATTADIADSTNRRYVTDAQLVVIGNTSGVNTGDQTNVSGNAGTVTTADAGGDTTTWPLLGTSQTGNQAPSTDAGLTYDASTNALTTTTFIGNLTGFANGNGFDATIGASGADYTTISAALAASKARLLAIDTVTETVDCALPASGLSIYVLKGKTIDFNTNGVQFTRAGAYNLTVEGQDKDLCLFNYAFASAKNLVDGATGSSTFKNIHITNSSSNTLTSVTNGDPEEHYENVIMTAPNQTYAGISAYNVLSTLDNVEIIGGGVACDNALDIEVAVRCNNIIISGTFISTGGAYLGPALVNNINFNNAAAMVVSITSKANITNLYQNNSGLTLSLGGDAKLTNAYVLAVNGIVDVTNARVQLTNVQATTLDMTDAGASNCLMNNVRVTNAVTFGGDRNKGTNCDFLGGASISSGANDNGFSNCQYGPDGGGSGLTLTVDAGANRTRVSNCMSDVAIVDNGTGSGIDPVTNLVF